MKSKSKENMRKYPYARIEAISKLIAAIKEGEWRPSRIDVDLIDTLGIAPSKEYECISTLRFLGVIDDSGSPTPEFDMLKKDYKSALKQMVKAKYSAIFERFPITLINQHSLIAFFKKSGTKSQNTAEYQAKLFGWLCEQAGIELPNFEGQIHRTSIYKPAVV